MCLFRVLNIYLCHQLNAVDVSSLGMKMKASLHDLDSWYREHMRKRNISTPGTRTELLWQKQRLNLPVPDDRPALHVSSSTGELVEFGASPSVTPHSRHCFSAESVSGGNDAAICGGRSLDDITSAGSKSSLIGTLLNKINRPAMKKSDPGKVLTIKNFMKGSSKSPSLPRKPVSSEVAFVSRPYHGSGNLVPPADEGPQSAHSTEDLEAVDSGKENGSDNVTDEDTNVDESLKREAAIERIQNKLAKTKDMIKTELQLKEANVNEYLRVAASSTDKQQAQRIKAVFEKRNQKSTQIISQLQKKLEGYQRKAQDIEMHGVSGHKQAKAVLKDIGQGMKDVGANIVDGITGFSGGVVGNIKGAKDSIVSKPKEFAHHIKKKFGSADNINQLNDGQEEGETQPSGGTLPASFRYGSEDDNSSITSGSGFGVHSSPHSTSQNMSQAAVLTQSVIDPIMTELEDLKRTKSKLNEALQLITDEFDNYKISVHGELSLLRSMLEEEKYKVDRLEDQMNDLTELHQNEITNLKQDIGSMEEKIEYRLDERTTDLSDLVDNCQTRIQRLEQQQQQQQILSMEMVENVTFRTLLTKLINVALAIVAVILVFVSTAANFVSPFLTSRMRILSTVILVVVLAYAWQNREMMVAFFHYVGHQVDRLRSPS
ncbi:transmembrane and coiled-coil domains protein 1-like isoform X2 [Gigantopelta aegis]|uniref:transmembrane and coiled-coil domains protein 1-like isoform X2 n=1 Tax=Gigantopelta aegis TaxID=1735272 RepID=UPI001B8888C4|nr:transmembrane and coiled-coil domains protein 1-like isoform X2 [Gigantopelta aegis]